MSKKREGMDYSDFYFKRYRDKPKLKYSNEYSYYNETPRQNNIDTHHEVILQDTDIPRITALIPDEIDNEPYYESHKVEYIPVKQNDNCVECKPKRRKKRNPVRFRALTLVIITILLCFGVTLLVSDALSGGYMLDSAQAFLLGKSKNRDYFAVEMASFTDLQTAKVYSKDLRLKGGGGYVINDELYRVIADVYPNRKDADTVSARLNMAGYLSTVYVISMSEIDYGLLPSSTRNITKKTIQYSDNLYKKIYSMTTRMDKEELDENGAIAELKVLKSEISNILLEYESNVDNKLDDEYVIKVRVQLSAVIGAIDNLCEKKTGGESLISDLRYTNAMILNTHRALTISLTNNKK